LISFLKTQIKFYDNNINIMEFTGEQLILGATSKRVMNDHLARYKFASGFVKGKKVLY